MTSLLQARPAEILLVEDNEHDVILTREGFAESRLAVNLHRAENGEECLRFLRKRSPFENVPTPDLVLLDLNMPVMDGREVLAEITADPALSHLPVVILTTSAAEEDVLSMYKLRCSSYMVKPIDFDQFVQVIRTLGKYWFTVVVLPTPADEK